MPRLKGRIAKLFDDRIVELPAVLAVGTQSLPDLLGVFPRQRHRQAHRDLVLDGVLACIAQRGGVRPEHVGIVGAGEQVAAQSPGPLSGGDGPGGHPQRRVRLLHRLGLHLHVLERESAAFEGDPVLGPGATHDLDALLHPRRALLVGHVQRLELQHTVADADADVQPAAQEVVQNGHLLGYEQRVVQGQDLDIGADADSLRLDGQSAGEGGKGRAVARLLILCACQRQTHVTG